ncbi:MAG TPA: hypothetical protein VF660_00365 [Actinomycetota bacterium]
MAENKQNVVDSVLETASDVLEASRAYLASEEGRELRQRVAKAIIIAAPLVSELPVWRRTPLARLVRAASLTTLLVKGAEWLRDWEPAGEPEYPPRS